MIFSKENYHLNNKVALIKITCNRYSYNNVKIEEITKKDIIAELKL